MIVRHIPTSINGEGLKVHKRRHKKLHIGCSENACNRKRPEYYNLIWSYDLLSKRLENGKLPKLPVVLDESTRECLAIDVGKKWPFKRTSSSAIVERPRDLYEHIEP